ncbi:hypothetical protein FOA52_005216 [Chlamydomonas sp. UWO 241]|nr:hypothetical protein FOA52_005216 [Chlamydomonas sp. UWO 241]
MGSNLVLFSPDLWAELWRWLDRGSKAAMRSVSVAMRDQVDAAVVRVASSPEAGFTAKQLKSALVRWHGIVDLALLGMGDGSDLAPLATASLAGLKSFTVREGMIHRT